jgi:enamine deaminase RidA (YjgF/YER057c/UK114 family)
MGTAPTGTLPMDTLPMDICAVMVPSLSIPGGHFCHANQAGPHVWISGMVGVRTDGTVGIDAKEQFDIALGHVDTVLRYLGAGSRNVVKLQIYLTDISDRARIHPARVAYFGEHLPASTLVEVSALAAPGLCVEVDAQAFIA